MQPVSRWLIVAGAVLILAGLLWQFGGRQLGLGRLPGDIRIERGDFRLHIPVATCLLLSFLVSVALWLLRGGPWK